MPIRIYFRVLSLQTRHCSLRIQAYRPKRAVTLAVCVFQVVACTDGHDGRGDDRRDGRRIGGRRIGRARPVRRKFFRCLARQLIRPRRFARLAHRRRRLWLWIPRRIFSRGLGRLARRGGRNFGRLDRHLHRDLAIRIVAHGLLRCLALGNDNGAVAAMFPPHPGGAAPRNSAQAG